MLYFINKSIIEGEIIKGVGYLENAFNLFCKINFLNAGNDENISKKLRDRYFRHFNQEHMEKDNELEFTLPDVTLSKIIVNEDKLKKVKIALANLKVNTKDIESSYLNRPNINGERYNRIIEILNNALKEKVDMIVFPEVSIPYKFLPLLSRFSMQNNIAIVLGVEHIISTDKKAFNYLATILPTYDGVTKSSIIKFRLKNHYSPGEEEILVNNYRLIPRTQTGSKYYYDLFVWRGVHFACFNCFELANITHRALFKSNIDLLIASVYNRDTLYFSRISDSVARDTHCYFIQVNSSDYGDSKIIKPSSREIKDIIRLKGGINHTILVGEVDIELLRKFQIKGYTLQMKDKTFKPTPPDFNYVNVKKRLGLPKPY